MNMDRHGREFYGLGITTEPAVSAWEASFDGEATWVAGTTTDGVTRWLVAGPDYDDTVGAPATATVLTGSVLPKIRAVDNPEVIIRRAPRITVSD